MLDIIYLDLTYVYIFIYKHVYIYKYPGFVIHFHHFQQSICEHEIQNINCACQDSDDLRHFAYITKELDVHYCHVFYVKSAVS